jgi:hypothetical protein
MVYKYGLKNGPVYRQAYYMHKTEVKIPEERAIRVKFTKEVMLSSFRRICLNSNKSYSLLHDLNQHIQYVSTDIRYEQLHGGKHDVIIGDNKTINIEKDSLGQSVEVSTIVGYDEAIVANTKCTQILRVINGTVVRMYATNPDFNESIGKISTIVFFTALGIFGCISVVMGVYLYCIKSV